MEKVTREHLAGYMPIPTAEQLAEALENVGSFHDMSAELIAPKLLANLLKSTAKAVESLPVGVPDAWRPVPVESLTRIAQFIDPPPVRLPNGATMVFKNPYAAEALREISEEFRAMLAAAPSAQLPAPERVSVPVELVRRVCWPVVSGSDRHTHSEAVAELRALLASSEQEVEP